MRQIIWLMLLVSISTASSIVNITLSRDYTTEDFMDFFESFYALWLPYIAAIFVPAIAFSTGDRYSQIITNTGIGYIACGFIFAMDVFFFGGIFFLIVGAILKYVIG